MKSICSSTSRTTGRPGREFGLGEAKIQIADYYGSRWHASPQGDKSKVVLD